MSFCPCHLSCSAVAFQEPPGGVSCCMSCTLQPMEAQGSQTRATTRTTLPKRAYTNCEQTSQSSDPVNLGRGLRILISSKIAGDAEAAVLGNLPGRTTVLVLQNLFLFSNISVILATKALHLLLLLIRMFFLPRLSPVSSCPYSLLMSLGRG